MIVLQIANDYIDRKLYRILFENLREIGVTNWVYVPVNFRREISESFDENVLIDHCFSNADRILFYRKQRRMFQTIVKQWDMSQISFIHAHTLFSGGYTAWKLHQQYHIPYIVAVRNTDKNVFFRYMVHLRHTGVQIMRDASAVIFLSPAYQDSIIDTYVPPTLQKEIYSKSRVIPNGISDKFIKDRAQPHLLQEDNVKLLYVGEISDNKNISTTVTAIEQLHREGISATLTVAGTIRQKKYEDYLKKYSFITYLGQISMQEVKELLRKSDVFVMPSHMETFGLVYAEAMSQGVPVLYTKGQGFDGHFPDGTVGYAVDDHDPSDVAAKIKAVICNYDRMAQNAYDNSTIFSWKAIAEDYLNIYQNL